MTLQNINLSPIFMKIVHLCINAGNMLIVVDAKQNVYLKGCGMGPWLVLVSPCFRENVVVTCKIGSFLYSLDDLL